MSDTTTTTEAVATPSYAILLVGRQSYDLNTYEYKLIPSIDTLAKARVTSPMEAWEVYQHMLELADVLNDDISEVTEAYSEAVEKYQEEHEDDDDSVVETSDDSPVLDFSEIFTEDGNAVMGLLAGRIRKGGYSQMSVYLEYSYSADEIVTLQPTEFSEVSRLL